MNHYLGCLDRAFRWLAAPGRIEGLLASLILLIVVYIFICYYNS